MRVPMFGRKGLRQPPSPPPPPPAQPATSDPGHAAVLRHLRDIEGGEPLARPQLAGRVMFDFVMKTIQTERGVRVEDAIGILAANGGFACIVAALDTASRSSTAPGKGELVTVQAQDGTIFYFGDLPNRYLIESQYALLSLALGAAQACGGTVSLEMVHDAMGRVAGSVGGSEFGQPDVPEQHRPGDLPINYVRYLWPRIVAGLDLYEVAAEQRPMAMGFALQQVITAGKDVIDPTIAARIALECAVPMAKLDPARFS